jgi:hypothetical protein
MKNKKVYIVCVGTNEDKDFIKLISSLEKEAKNQERSKSNMVKIILMEYFKNKS